MRTFAREVNALPEIIRQARQLHSLPKARHLCISALALQRRFHAVLDDQHTCARFQAQQVLNPQKLNGVPNVRRNLLCITTASSCLPLNAFSGYSRIILVRVVQQLDPSERISFEKRKLARTTVFACSRK